MKKARRKLLAVGGLAAAGTVITAMAALDGIPGVAVAGPEPGRHCVENVQTGRQQCFDTFTAAIAYASGGTVKDAPADTRAAVTDRKLRTRIAGAPSDTPTLKADGEVIVGTVFADPNYGGDSHTVVAPTLCTKNGVVDWQYDLPEEWKNRISAVTVWGNCWIWLYPEPGLNGDRDGPFKEDTSDIGAFMNDRAQSIGFS